MKCELCNSGHREHESKLCEPCTEAIVRLWTIAKSTCLPINDAGEAVGVRSTSQRAAMFAKLPIAALR